MVAKRRCFHKMKTCKLCRDYLHACAHISPAARAAAI
jgi:hypothetical protein